ncbi:type IV secretory system conjugative DNA transfer family protein [Mycoplasma feriruminatoris]|uniref:Conjugal transfer protein TraG n=1 Tax=Mycoplasma feriruminatoris TaxID=1179777 RepID=A0AAX3TIE6_9MOLU|nr:type IV secretory system conjugative DNA transfer family protein [Mycoplasma feriruminatoris]WFQ93036.1 hypothetical protein MFERI14822_00829 [Mycoplasma feriruminatoris]
MGEQKIKNINKVLSYVFSFVIWPSLAFFLIATIMILLEVKSFQIVTNWILHKRSYTKDIFIFWKINTYYRNLSILFILLGIPIFLTIFNYRYWWKAFKERTRSKSNPKKKSWEWNQFTKEGNFKSLKRKFKPGKANFALGYLDWKNHNQYLVNNTDSHAIVLGIPGSKKTEKIVLPNLHYNASLPFDEKPNMVITDPKKQILSRTGEMFVNKGYNVKVFDFSDARNSLCWNPLEQVWNTVHSKDKRQLDEYDYASAYEKIIQIVNSLSWPPDDKSMWTNNAKNVLICLLKFQLLYSLEDDSFTLDYFTLANLTPNLSERNIKMGRWVRITEKNKSKNIHWNNLYNEQKAIIDIVPETLSGILTNAIDVVVSFSQNLNISKITSNITFSVKETIRDTSKPFAIFICFPDHKNIFDFLMSMLITQIYQESVDFANSQPKQKLKRMLQFYLEEFNSLSIPEIPDWMAISRSRNILFMLIIQSYEQLQKYSAKGRDYKTIKSQARLNYLLETNSEETLKSFSSSLGEKLVKKETVSKNDKSTSVSTSEQKELIMSVSEIKYKDPDMTIISTGGSKPIALKLKPAYEYLKYTPFENEQPKLPPTRERTWDFEQMRLNVLDSSWEDDEDDEVEEVEEVVIKEEKVSPNNDSLLKDTIDNLEKFNSLCADFKSNEDDE